MAEFVPTSLLIILIFIGALVLLLSYIVQKPMLENVKHNHDEIQQNNIAEEQPHSDDIQIQPKKAS